MSINWQQYGLKNNPYDTAALIEGGDLPLDKAFVGRNNEIEFLDKAFSLEDNLNLTMCGNVGVGKTSLANYYKFLYKFGKKQKQLFSFRREIEASLEILNKRNFLIEIMASVLREIRLLEPKLLGKHEELKNINLIVDISHQLGLSGGLTGGFSGWQLGADFGKEKSISQPNHIPISTLESYFQSLVQFIRDHSIQGKKFEGLIVHVNNFDVVLENIDNKKVVVNFFNEIRDILQMKHVYYLFLGPKSFYKDIISKKQRVKSIFFQTPLSVEPLNKTEIIEAFKERMEILKSEDVVNYIEPFENEVIYQIYDLYDGDIRSIMSALKDILISHSDRLSQTLSKDEAMLLLGRERWERIAIQLKDKAKEALIFFIQSGKFLSQKDLMKEFSQAQSNISGYYLKPLKEQNIIEEKSRKNKMIYWGLTKQYEPLRYIQRSKQAISDKMGKGQIPLFLR